MSNVDHGLIWGVPLVAAANENILHFLGFRVYLRAPSWRAAGCFCRLIGPETKKMPAGPMKTGCFTRAEATSGEFCKSITSHSSHLQNSGGRKAAKTNLKKIVKKGLRCGNLLSLNKTDYRGNPLCSLL
ncbi:MAG: hypothetical protein NTW28_08430, partial [Candidatus Solibacter sp.]|nr:hypothetical protein [Candidatus Solibacter sp.]